MYNTNKDLNFPHGVNVKITVKKVFVKILEAAEIWNSG